MDKQEIDQKVHALLEQCGYSFDDDSDVDIMNIAHKLGFVVGNADLPDNEDGFLAIKPRNSEGGSSPEKIIGVNAKRQLEFKRFIIAHEVAHWKLHCNDGQAFLHRDHAKGKDDKENDADYFAAALLMPQESFQRIYSELNTNALNIGEICLKLASIFKVPLESALRRIGEVIPENQF